MSLPPNIIDELPLAKDTQGKLKSRIGTVFPHDGAIITWPPIHSAQRERYLKHVNQERRAAGQPPLTPAEETELWNAAVDLIVEDDTIYIRPDPDNMPLAFLADKVLQKRVSKHQIKFLHVLNAKVRDAVKRRGECWRIAALPTSRTEMKRRVTASRIALGGGEIYYHNATTGTRWLTCHEFARLGAMDDVELRRHLLEICKFLSRQNHCGRPEIALFLAGASLPPAALVEHDFGGMADTELRSVYKDLAQRFAAAVPVEFRLDDPENAAWRHRVFSALIAESDEVVAEEILLGLSPEFFMQIRWLPGGRVVNGELLFDEVFEEERAADPRWAELRDENAREFLLNLAREYDDLEYVNIGRVINSLSRRLESRGRRDVYLAVIKQQHCKEEAVSFIRMQKWGVREHLDEDEPLERAFYLSEEYTEYVLDRRLACRHLGMNIPRRITARRIHEKYYSPHNCPQGMMIWSPYFERAYIPGVATDKIPRHRFADADFARQFARLLGLAAAPNMIVGRCDSGCRVLFDDGDEVLVEDGREMRIVVADQTGTFNEYQKELQAAAPAYAGPVNRRLEYLANPEEFAQAYLDAFVERFLCIQQKYRKRRRAFETMFRNRIVDENGNFAYRWLQVLKRLDRSDPRKLEELIRASLL